MTMLSEIAVTGTALSSVVPHASQVFILDSLATYKPRDGKDAESIVERVTPRLQHANCAVVLSAVKVSGQSHACANTLCSHVQACVSSCLFVNQATYIAVVMLPGNASLLDNFTVPQGHILCREKCESFSAIRSGHPEAARLD